MGYFAEVCDIEGRMYTMLLFLLGIWSLTVSFVIGTCPEININYSGNDLGCVHNVNSWQECSAYCRGLPKCRYWTWISDALPEKAKWCCPKVSDGGKAQDNRMISGSMDCGQSSLTLQEVKFEGGRASASSIYDTSSNYVPSHAFQLAPTHF